MYGVLEFVCTAYYHYIERVLYVRVLVCTAY
jgi:hypothetical protein